MIQHATSLSPSTPNGQARVGNPCTRSHPFLSCPFPPERGRKDDSTLRPAIEDLIAAWFERDIAPTAEVDVGGNAPILKDGAYVTVERTTAHGADRPGA